MNMFLPFIVIGLAAGAAYGLAGVGLVLTYKASGTFNVGYGAVAALVAYCFYFLHASLGMPWPFAALISLLVLAPMVGLALARATDLTDLPSDYLKVGSSEVFRDKPLGYAGRLAKAGVPMEVYSWADGFHVFEIFAPEAAMSQACVATRTSYLQRALRNTAMEVTV